MRKIGVITDVHGNLPALQAILARLQAEKVEEILHLGDVVDMGPYSAECLHLLHQTPNVTMLMGNHDKDFVMNDYIAKHLSHVPTEHKKFVFGGLTEDDRQIVAATIRRKPLPTSVSNGLSNTPRRKDWTKLLILLTAKRCFSGTSTRSATFRAKCFMWTSAASVVTRRPKQRAL